MICIPESAGNSRPPPAATPRTVSDHEHRHAASIPPKNQRWATLVPEHGRPKSQPQIRQVSQIDLGRIQCKPFGSLQACVPEMTSTYAMPRADSLTFEAFYLAEFDRVLDSAFAFSGDRDAATDATQEAFARAFARWRRLSRQEWAGGWVTTTALNVLRRRFRDAVRSQPPVERATSPDSHGRVDLLRGLQALPVRQRQAAVLFYVADLPLHAVAEAMGVSDGAVKSHLARAREGLRVTLEERDA